MSVLETVTKTGTDKKKKVLLVCPKFPDTYWSFSRTLRLIRGLKASMAPVGMATLAAMLPAEHFETMRILDLNVEKLSDTTIRSADIVMVTGMVVQKESMREIITRCKALGKTVVVGGPYASSYAEEVLAMGADHIVEGEAEMTLAPFLEDLLAGNAERIYSEKSVIGRIAVALTREGKPVLSATPIPRWDLLNLKNYASVAIQYSRGCPFRCDFCTIIQMFGRIPRTKSASQMIAEIEALYQAGWRGTIFIVDDNFIGNQIEVRKFLPELIRWQEVHGYPFSFYTEASLNLAEESLRDVREMMVNAGFTEIFCGIESLRKEVLAAMGKSQNLGELSMAEKVVILQNSGLEPMAGIIVGNDGDRPEDLENLFLFLQEYGIVMSMAGLLTALKGSELYERLKSEKRLRGESDGNNTHGFEFNFVPKCDEEALICAYVELLRKLYSPANYYARCEALRRRRGKRRVLGRATFQNIFSLASLFFRNLVVRPDWYFIKFIAKTLVTDPRGFSDAVEKAFKFVHFRDITDELVREYNERPQ